MVIDMSWTNNDKTKAVQTKESDKGKYALRKKAMLEQIKQAQENNKSFLCLGIWGEPKSAKSATAMDLLTDEDIKNGCCLLPGHNRTRHPAASQAWPRRSCSSERRLRACTYI